MAKNTNNKNNPLNYALREYAASTAIKRDELNNIKEKLYQLIDKLYNNNLLEFIDECDRAREQRKQALLRHIGFFNTNPYMTFIIWSISN